MTTLRKMLVRPMLKKTSFLYTLNRVCWVLFSFLLSDLERMHIKAG